MEERPDVRCNWIVETANHSGIKHYVKYTSSKDGIIFLNYPYLHALYAVDFKAADKQTQRMPLPQREKLKLTISARTLIAKNLVRLRAAKGWSQEDLAWDAGLHRTFVGQVERELRNVSVDNVESLAAALGVDIRELFAPSPDETK